MDAYIKKIKIIRPNTPHMECQYQREASTQLKIVSKFLVFAEIWLFKVGHSVAISMWKLHMFSTAEFIFFRDFAIHVILAVRESKFSIAPIVKYACRGLISLSAKFHVNHRCSRVLWYLWPLVSWDEFFVWRDSMSTSYTSSYVLSTCYSAYSARFLWYCSST